MARTYEYYNFDMAVNKEDGEALLIFTTLPDQIEQSKYVMKRADIINMIGLMVKALFVSIFRRFY